MGKKTEFQIGLPAQRLFTIRIPIPILVSILVLHAQQAPTFRLELQPQGQLDYTWGALRRRNLPKG